MFTPDRELCRNFSAPFCGKNDTGDVVEYTYTLQRPNQGHQFEYVFCSTSNSYLSTVIDWENERYEGDDGTGESEDDENEEGSEGVTDEEESGTDGDEEGSGDDENEEDGEGGDEDFNTSDAETDDIHENTDEYTDSREKTSTHGLENGVLGTEDDGVDLVDV
ncbi:hypothetical protein AAHC03_022699 [Spirometra sp. Aus1]